MACDRGSDHVLRSDSLGSSGEVVELCESKTKVSGFRQGRVERARRRDGGGGHGGERWKRWERRSNEGSHGGSRRKCGRGERAIVEEEGGVVLGV